MQYKQKLNRHPKKEQFNIIDGRSFVDKGFE